MVDTPRNPSPNRVGKHHRVRFALILVLAPATAAVATLALTGKSSSNAATIATSRPTTTTTLGSTTTDTTPSTTTTLAVAPVANVQTVVSDTGSPLAASLAAFVDTLPTSACLVVDVGDTRVVSVRATKSLAPASTEKVLTGTAALNVFGPTYKFVTNVVAAAPAQGGKITGDLYLVGSGDPVLSTVGYQKAAKHQPALATSIETLADNIVAAGIKNVTGTLIGDESKFANDRSGATWGFQYDVTTGTGPLSALVLNDSFTEDGSAVESPPAYAAKTLQKLLEKRGVSFGGNAISGIAPKDTHVVASIESPPLLDIVSEMLRNSDNLTAEMLAKSIDAASFGPASIESGAASVVKTLAAQGFDTSGVKLIDSSGLDRANRATCNALTSTMHAIGRRGEIGTHGLAVAGESGTLSKRYVKTAAAGRLRAKTGSIPNVAGLVGFVDPPTNSKDPIITFSLLLNGVDDGQKYVIEDALVKILTEFNLAPTK